MYYKYETVGLLLSSQSDIYSMYSGSYYIGVGKPFMVILLYVALYMVVFFRIKQMDLNTEDSPNKRLMLSGAVLSVLFVPLILLDPSLIRISGYFYIWLGLLVPRCICMYSKKFSRLFFWGVIILFIYKANKSGLDYAFFWQFMQSKN